MNTIKLYPFQRQRDRRFPRTSSQNEYLGGKFCRSIVNMSFNGWADKFAEKVPNGILKSKGFHWILEKAENNPSFFQALVVTAVTTTLRPLTILATPGAERKDKEYAASHAIASGIATFILALLIYAPMERSVKRLGGLAKKLGKEYFPHAIDTNKYDAYKYLTNYGSQFIVAPLQTMLLLKFIPVIMKRIFPDKNGKQPVIYSNPLLNNHQQNLFKDFILKGGGNGN